MMRIAVIDKGYECFHQRSIVVAVVSIVLYVMMLRSIERCVCTDDNNDGVYLCMCCRSSRSSRVVVE